MTFTFNPTNLNKPGRVKCPWAIAERLFEHTGIELHKGMKFYITNVNNLALGFDIRYGNALKEGRLFIIYKETMLIKAKPENLDLFELVITNSKHGGEAAEMPLEFLLNTL